MDALRRPDVNIGSWLTHRAAERPEHPAISVEATGECLSYCELNALTNRVARSLELRGVGLGERVAMALRSEPLTLAVYFGAAKLGAISVPLNTRLAPPELGFQIQDCRPRLVIRARDVEMPADCGTELISADELRAELPTSAEEPALAAGGEAAQTIMYTSGTTGLPKGAVLPHRKTLCNTLNAEVYLGLRPEDVVVVPVPLFHSYGLKILSVPTLFAGATIVLVDRFDPVGLQECIGRHRATLLGAVPVMYRRMLEAGLRGDCWRSLRFAFGAGAPLDVATIHRFFDAGVRLKQGYGQTETSILCCLDTEDVIRHAGSVGRPVGNCELRIADAEGATVAPGHEGEILVRGRIVMSGYWGQPEATEASRLDGWHRTGDLGVMDGDGFVTLVGRRAELFISGGENVYPAEVERVVEGHENVSEVAVVGVPDDRWGESGRAYVVPAHPPLDTAELLEWTRKRLAAFKVPLDVVVVAELPRTASGKVQKHALLEQS